MENKEVGYLTNEEGNKSSMRLCTLIGNLFIIPVLMLTWMIICFMRKDLCSFGYGEVALIFAINVPNAAQKAIEVWGKVKGV